jgi:hypothetical protein
LADSLLDAMVAAQQPSVRDANGRFRPGVAEGKPKRGVTRLTRAMRETAAAMCAEGDPTINNPLCVAHRVMVTAEDPRTKLAAADLLSKYLFSTKQTLEIEAPDQADEARIERTKQLLNGLVQEIVQATNDR